MKDFNGFIIYATANQQRVKAELSNIIAKGNITLTEDDAALISQIAMKVSYAQLRLYHEWLNRESDEHL